jgi:hypothetical protein
MMMMSFSMLRALVTTVMNFRFLKMRGISWVAAKPASFSKMTLLHGVSKLLHFSFFLFFLYLCSPTLSLQTCLHYFYLHKNSINVYINFSLLCLLMSAISLRISRLLFFLWFSESFIMKIGVYTAKRSEDGWKQRD